MFKIKKGTSFHLFKLAVLTLCLVIQTSCIAERKHAVAELCMLADVHGDDTKVFFQDFEQFKGLQALAADRSHSLGVEYQSESEQLRISVRGQFGPYGSVISLYRFDEKLGLEIKKDFEIFIWNDLASKYSIKNCTDVKDFKMPEIWL